MSGDVMVAQAAQDERTRAVARSEQRLQDAIEAYKRRLQLHSRRQNEAAAAVTEKPTPAAKGKSAATDGAEKPAPAAKARRGAAKSKTAATEKSSPTVEVQRDAVENKPAATDGGSAGVENPAEDVASVADAAAVVTSSETASVQVDVGRSVPQEAIPDPAADAAANVAAAEETIDETERVLADADAATDADSAAADAAAAAEALAVSVRPNASPVREQSSRDVRYAIDGPVNEQVAPVASAPAPTLSQFWVNGLTVVRSKLQSPSTTTEQSLTATLIAVTNGTRGTQHSPAQRALMLQQVDALLQLSTSPALAAVVQRWRPTIAAILQQQPSKTTSAAPTAVRM